MGYIRDTAKQTAAVLPGQNFDFVLLSTHCVDGIDCYLPESKWDRDKVTAYKRYLETVYDSVMDDNLTEYYDKPYRIYSKMQPLYIYISLNHLFYSMHF